MLFANLEEYGRENFGVQQHGMNDLVSSSLIKDTLEGRQALHSLLNVKESIFYLFKFILIISFLDQLTCILSRSSLRLCMKSLK